MSREAEPVENAPKPEAPKAPEAPVPEPQAPVMAPPVTDTVFGTGVGAGMGAPTNITFTRHLARRPAEERKSVIDDLNGRVGNRRVTRMLRTDTPVLGRVGLHDSMPVAPRRSDRELIAEGIAERDAGTLKDVRNWGAATETQRMQAVAILLDQSWVGPGDEYALEAIWNSFGESLGEVASRNHATWTNCISRGMDPSSIGALDALRSAFERDVKTIARDYMQQNLEFATTEMQRLGIRRPEGNLSPTHELEEALHLQEVQELAAGAEQLLEAKERMRTVHVGYRASPGGRAVAYSRMNFDPNQRPARRMPPERPQIGEIVTDRTEPAHTWEEVKEQWDTADAALAGVGARNPTVFAAIAGGREQVQGLASENPQQARATAERVLQTLHDNIQATIPKIDTGDLDWRDLQPIHQQLYGGAVRGPSGNAWNEPFLRSIGQDVIGDHETSEFWIGLGLGSAAAALFIVASIASGGLATAALLGGLTVSGGQAVRSWENYEDLATAAAGTASEETRLVSQGQVDAALLQAILDTIFAALDFGQAVRIGRGIAAAAAMERALATNSAEAMLEAGMRAGGPEAAQAIERSVSELGVEATMRRTGKSIDELLELLPADSVARGRLQEARRLGLTAVGEAGEQEARLAATAGNAAEEAWKGSRPLGELMADLPGAVAGGTISRQFADQLAVEAIERLGPAEALKRCGGWRRLQQTLSDESAAGARLMSWRDSVFADLQRYVTEDLGGQVQRTGTVERFSNDIDMSFIGPRASEMRDAASQYLARRLGVGNSAGEFDRLMMAGLFTDPRRMHAYDALPAAIRDRIAATQAAKEEQLIWNRRLWEASHAGDEQMARQIREQMQTMGIDEYAFRPLSPGEVSRLSRHVDTLHGQLEAAVRNGDMAAQERLAAEIADAQALVNAADGGGYLSGGGVRRYVSERPGEPGFERPAGAAAGVPDPERLTSLIDQLRMLDHSALLLRGSTEEVVAGVRGIGKYGKRLFEATGDAGLFRDAAWEALEADCRRLKSAADSAGTAISQAEAQALATRARGMFGELAAKSSEALEQVRQAANVPSIGNAAEALQEMTTRHLRLLAAQDWVLRHINLLVRGVGTAARAPGGGDGPAVGRTARADGPVIARITDEDLSLMAEARSGGGEVDFAQLIRDRDVSGIKDAGGYGRATTTQRFQMMRIIIDDQLWIGPGDEYVLEAMWNSFGADGVAGAYESEQGRALWDECIGYGAELWDIAAVRNFRDHFESDVKAVARAYMRMNRRAVLQEAARLGLGDLEGGGEAAAVRPDAQAIEQVQQMAREVQRADEAMERLRSLPVGHNIINVKRGGGDFDTREVVATYTPGHPPDLRPGADETGFASYEEVDRQYQAVSQARAVLAARNPAVFAASEAGRGESGRVAEMDPGAAAARLRELLRTTLTNIDETLPKIDSGDLDWRDLQPIHQQLYGGLPAQSGTAWNTALAQGVARDVIGDYESTQFWVTLGLGTLTAAAFIFSEIATGGMATFLWAAAGVGLAGTQAAMSWERYEDLATAAGATASGDTRLVRGEQVSEALLAAVLDTAFAFLDGISAVRGVASAVRATAAREAIGQLGRLSGPEARQAIEQAVRELGPEEAIRRSGRSAEELAEIVGRESEAGQAIRGAAGDITVAPPQMAGTAADTAPAPVTEAGRRAAAEAEQVLARWATLTPLQRAQELLSHVNAQLRRIGAPDVDVVLRSAGRGRGGHFQFTQWELAIDEQLLRRAEVTAAEFEGIVNTVVHEGRHAEQWFRMAQIEAMSGRNAREIAERLHIPEEVADAAIEVQNGFRAGERLAGGAAEAQARLWYESVYGANSTVRNRILDELRDSTREMAEATRQLDGVKDLPVGHARRQAAEQEFRRVARELDDVYREYRALPEEIDAWAVGDAAGAAMRERFDMMRRISAARAVERQAFQAYEPLEQLYESILGRPHHHLSYDNMLAFDQASRRWQQAIYVVAQLEEELGRLGRAAPAAGRP